MKIPVLKQHTDFGCFVACCAMVESLKHKIHFDKEEEIRRFAEANVSHRLYEIPLLNNLAALGFGVSVYTESPWVAEQMRDVAKSVSVEHNYISRQFCESLLRNHTIITLLDKWHLDMYVHSLHYVILKKIENGMCTILDPYPGKKILFPIDRFFDSVSSIRERFGYAPMIVAIKSTF